VTPRDEVVLHLRRVDELFAVDPKAVLHDPGCARIQSGIDELLDELLARPPARRAARLVVTLPRNEVAEDTGPRLTAAVSRWCAQRIEQDEREARVLWRQGLRSLRSGVLLFVVGLLLSSEFLAPEMPDFLQEALGNGVFLVIAWVGLWYPLDLLFFARQPLRRELRVLDAMTRLPIDVRPRPDGGDPSSAAETAVGGEAPVGATSPDPGVTSGLAMPRWLRRPLPVTQHARRRGRRGARRAR
jgi:hypothetical protein